MLLVNHLQPFGQITTIPELSKLYLYEYNLPSRKAMASLAQLVQKAQNVQSRFSADV